MQLVTVPLLLALLGAPLESHGSPISTLLDTYAEKTPAETATVVLRGWEGYSKPEREAASLLLAEDLVEMGLDSLALVVVDRVSRSPAAGQAAFLARTRIEEAPAALCAHARYARWKGLGDDDFAAAAFRVGRACYRAGRYPEARDWLAKVPADSSWAPFARFVSAQGEYALDRPGRAIAAVEPLFHGATKQATSEELTDRTAVWVGDLLTEVGLFDDAAAVLAWPEPESAFAERAERDRMIAASLAAAGRGGVPSETSTGDVERSFAAGEDALAAAVDGDAALAARAGELKQTWPNAEARTSRRNWTASEAREALDRAQGWTLRRALDVVWRSSPPGLIYALFHHTPSGSAGEATLAADARWFFTPEGDVKKDLLALALLDDDDDDDDPVTGKDCGAKAADTLRRTVAAATLEGAKPLGEDSLARLARGCGNPEPSEPTVRQRLEESLRTAIASQALERRRELRRQRQVYREAVAQASLDAAAAVRSAREHE